MENARMIKCDEEIQAMRCAIFACEKAMTLMREDAVPGNSENKLWARFYSECILRGSEWIETRLLAAGPRTNPWFQECSSRPMRRGEIVAFDTDLIGAFGICVDISRSWTVGGEKPSAAQADLHRRAVEQTLAQRRAAASRRGIPRNLRKGAGVAGRRIPPIFLAVARRRLVRRISLGEFSLLLGGGRKRRRSFAGNGFLLGELCGAQGRRRRREV